MVGMQNEQLIECTRNNGIRFVLFRRHTKRHAQEVVLEAVGVVRVQERLTYRLLVGVRRNGWQFRHQANGRNVHLLGIERIQ